MGSPGKPERFTANGALSQTRRVAIDSITLCAGSDAATVTVKEGGSGGTVIWEGRVATANDSIPFPFPQGMAVTAAYITLTGTSPNATVVYR